MWGAVKLPRLKGGRIGPRRETCVYWGGPTAMVPSLHHGNIYIKRKLRVWRVRKLIFLVGAKTPLTCAGRRQSTTCQGRPNRAEKGNLCIFGWTCRHGTVFTPWKYLYEKEAMGMEKPYEKEARGMERPEINFPKWCKHRTYLCGPSKYSISTEAV